MESKLNSFGRVQGWVFGPWGEASEDIHALVQRIAKARLELQETLPRRRGRIRARAAQMSMLVADVRRQLSLAAVQGQARLLLDRLSQVGEGVTAAARRRDWAVELEAASARRRRRAQEVSRRLGRNIHGFDLL